MRSNIFPSVESITRLTSPPWEIQPWDTAKSYALFTEYYLQLPAERRSLAEAYRAYRAKTGRKQVEKIRQAPGAWQNYANGCNPRGQRPPETVYEWSLTWAQRALLRDLHIEKQVQEQLAQEIVEFRRKEIALGHQLLERAEAMLVAPLYVQEVMEDGKTIVVKPSDWVEADISRTAAAGSKLARLGYELGTENVAVTDWREKLVGAGMDPDSFIKIIAGALVAGNTQV